MKKALLFTDNATIQKLFSLSLEKKGMELVKGDPENPEIDGISMAFIDNDILNDKLKKLKIKKVLILGKNEEKQPGFDEYMAKPFLPTDLIELITKLEQEPEKNETDDNELTDFDDFDLSDELDDDFDLDENKDNQEDLSIDDDLDFDGLDFDDIDNDSNNKNDLDDALEIDNIELDDEDFSEGLEEINIDDIKSNKSDIDNLDLDSLDDDNKHDDLDDITIDDNDLNTDTHNENDNIDDLDLDSLDDDNKHDDLDDITIDDNDLNTDTHNENKNIDDLDLDSLDDDSHNNEAQGDNDMNLEEFEKEISGIDESSIADAIGEDIENLDSDIEEDVLSEEPNYEKIDENIIEETPQNNIIPNPQTNEEKQQTIASMLNLDLEALKNSGAKITITIEFDKE